MIQETKKANRNHQKYKQTRIAQRRKPGTLYNLEYGWRGRRDLLIFYMVRKQKFHSKNTLWFYGAH